MTFGLTSDGFQIKRLEDIEKDLNDSIKAIWPNARTDASSVLGQIIGVISKAYTDLWEQSELIYLSQWASSADGISLDYVLELNGLTRLDASKTLAVVGLKGTNGTIVQTGKQIRSSTNTELFQFLVDTEITNIGQNEIFVTIDEVLDSTDYTITTNLVPEFVNSGVGSTKEAIAASLVSQINLNGSYPATAEDLGNGIIHLKKKTILINVDVSPTAQVSWHSVGTVQALNSGAIQASSNSLTIIETPVSNWEAVNNFRDDGDYTDVGRDLEDDTEARIRRENSLKVVGGASLEAILARILDEVEGVTLIKGFVNRESIIVGSLKPHSIYLIIEGGTDEDIGNKIWEVKAGGTATNGTDFYDVTDSQGNIQRMFFDRPTDIDMYVRVTYTLYDEETFPIDGDDLIEEAVLEYGATLVIDEDVIPSRFFGPIYDKVSGIDSLIVEVSDDGVGWQTTKYDIENNEIAKFDEARITIVPPP
jgi:uncharacterized phage protein gp47/JayE